MFEKLIARLWHSGLALWMFPLLIYCIFYFPFLFQGKLIDANDAVNAFYPEQYNLYVNLKEGKFPFWSEKVFSGYPIYIEGESAYLNPLNIVTVLLFGPYNNFKYVSFAFFYIGALAYIYFLLSHGFSRAGALASVVVFYFSFFLLYHQAHFSMALTFYLLPLVLYLCQKVNSSKGLRYIFLLAFLFSLLFYYGSYQSILIILLCAASYSIVYKVSFKKVLLTYLFIVPLVLPILIPTLELYLRSNRAVSGISYAQGSFNPFMHVNSTYPYFFGTDDSYKWNTLSNDYLIHETYVYVGISSFILGVFGYLSLRDKRLLIFITLNILIYLILGFIRFTPILDLISFPLINIFRYWGRTVILFNLAISLCVGVFISNNNQATNLLSMKLKVAILLLLLFISQLIYSFFVGSTSSVFISQIKNRAFVFDQSFYLWVAVLILSLLLAIFKKKRITGYLILMLLCFDLYYFGSNILNSNAAAYDEVVSSPLTQLSKEAKNKRVVFLSDNSFYDKGLHLDSWGILGYSQFSDSNYENLLINFNIHKSKSFDTSLVVDKLGEIGVSSVLNESGEMVAVFSKGILGKEIDTTSYIKEEEGYITARQAFSKKQLLNTYVRNYPGWEVRINGKQVNILSEDSTFISFWVSSGLNTIEMSFIPRIFYYSLAAAILLQGCILVLVFKFRHRLDKS